ncbi:MAG: hypothetical protein IPP72_19965 [Chitinophagaceae bacterium]|nr:hypothetical protein [Chitinophagaceae bacterium]
MCRSPREIYLLISISLFIALNCNAQDSAFFAKHRAIYFPYPMYKEQWRSSLGFTLLTTPQDITEEVRLRIPCGNFTVLKKISNHFTAEGRIDFQFLQNHLSAGVQYVRPVSKKFYFSAGNDIGYWFGFLKIDGFDSKGSGWLTYPSVTFGYMTRKDLLITLKVQASVNLYYQAQNGENKFSSGKKYYNGEAFTLAIEQPFYHRKHLTLAFSAISNYFYWQTWSLFYKTNRKVFYPQITVGIIL